MYPIKSVEYRDRKKTFATRANFFFFNALQLFLRTSVSSLLNEESVRFYSTSASHTLADRADSILLVITNDLEEFF